MEKDARKVEKIRRFDGLNGMKNKLKKLRLKGLPNRRHECLKISIEVDR